jgi:DNA polymerase-3 subunit delta
VKANRSSVAQAVEQPDSKLCFYLFLGQDEAGSRALAAKLQESLRAAKFALSMSAVKASPALLVDEAAALSLFGERRLIWVEPAGNDLVEAVEALLAAESVESPVVAIAGALPKSSALLKLAESSPRALAYTSYLPEGDEAARIVAGLGRRVGLKIGLPVAARIAEACGNDQAIAMRELEKFALCIDASPNSPKELEHDVLDLVGADSSEGDLQRLTDLAMLGEIGALAEAVERLPKGTVEPIRAIRALQRRILMLAPARARLERGEPVDAVMTSLGKALFWKEKPLVQKMLARWTAEGLATAAERAGALERSLMFSEAPEHEALSEELFAIARKARSGAVR